MKTFRSLLVVAALLALSRPLHADPPKIASGIQAIVHDSVITYQEVDLFAAQAVDVASRQFRNDREGFKKKLDDLREESLKQLVERQLILHDFAAAGYNLPESIIDEAVKDRIRDRYGDRKTLTKTLQAQGMTYERFRQQMREQIIVEALRSKNISSEIIISPKKIERYYNEHATNYQVEDQVNLRMIVLNKPIEADTEQKKLADDIIVKLKEGANFTEMAKVYSQGSQRDKSAYWTRSSLKKELADVAFTLKAGEFSPVIETPKTVCILLVEENKPAHISPLAEVRDEIEKNLLVEERARLDKQYTDKLKKKTFVISF